MLSEPISQAAKQYGYSVWPWEWWHWWHTLTAADQGAWFGGIGSFAVAGIALGLGLRDGIRLERERNRDAASLIAFLEEDLRTIDAALTWLIERAEDMNAGLKGFLPDDLQKMNRLAHDNLASDAVYSRVDRFSLLPKGVGIQLGGAIGKLRPIMARTQNIETTIRSKQPSDYPEIFDPYIKLLRDAKTGIEPALKFAKARR